MRNSEDHASAKHVSHVSASRFLTTDCSVERVEVVVPLVHVFVELTCACGGFHLQQGTGGALHPACCRYGIEYCNDTRFYDPACDDARVSQMLANCASAQCDAMVGACTMEYNCSKHCLDADARCDIWVGTLFDFYLAKVYLFQVFLSVLCVPLAKSLAHMVTYERLPPNPCGEWSLLKVFS